MSSEEDPRQSQEAGPVQPGGPAGELRLTDPKAMRALAHPVRMALLEVFSVTETLTATQASEMLGESPANCAFHLRTLAKYGYIKEAGGGRGRERPWTIAHRSITISGRDQEPQSAPAAKALSTLFTELVLQRIGRAFAADSWPAGWEHTAQSAHAIVYLTAEETAQAARDMGEVLKKYEARRFDPSLRPAGALPVEFTRFGYVREDLIALAAQQADRKETDE